MLRAALAAAIFLLAFVNDRRLGADQSPGSASKKLEREADGLNAALLVKA